MTRFIRGQILIAQASAQGLIAERRYQVKEVRTRRILGETYASYRLASVSEPVECWVVNAHLLLKEAPE